MKVLLFCLALNPIYLLAQTNRISEELSKIPHGDMRQDIYSDGLYLCDSMIGYMFNTAMDSSINNKSVYSYDMNGNTTIYSYYNWDEVFNKFIITGSDTTTYNPAGEIETQKRFSWNSGSKEPNSGWSMENVFDSYGNQIIHIESSLDTFSNQFINQIKLESFYNLSNYVDSSINYKWSSVTSTWKFVSKSKSTTIYEDDVLVIRELCLWDTLNNQWLNSYKYAYKTTTDSITYIAYSWDKNVSEWVYSTKFEMALNDFGIPEIFTYYDWDTTFNQWIGTWKTEDTYDDNGNRVLYINYRWDKIASEWVGQNKEEYTYNADSSRIEILSFLWNNTISEWSLHGKDEYFYDEYGSQYLRIYSSWFEDYNQWYVGSKYYSYNSLHNSVVNGISANNSHDKIRIYPNPVKERIYIEIKDLFVSSVQLINFRGQLITTFTISQGLNTYDINHLPGGIYIIKVVTNDDELNYKILKVD